MILSIINDSPSFVSHLITILKWLISNLFFKDLVSEAKISFPTDRILVDVNENMPVNNEALFAPSITLRIFFFKAVNRKQLFISTKSWGQILIIGLGSKFVFLFHKNCLLLCNAKLAFCSRWLQKVN